MASAADDEAKLQQVNNAADATNGVQVGDSLLLAEKMAKEYRNLVCTFCQNFFTDARTLSCGHEFCFPCLVGIQTGSKNKPCPSCELQTIPPVGEVKDLTPNQEVNKAVGVAILRIVTSQLGREHINHITTYNLEPHTGVECGNCHQKNFSGFRFLCGNCRNYNLCAYCEAKPRADIHPRTHLFIKFKKPAEIQPPKIPVLKKIADEVSKSLDFSSKHHSYVVNETDSKVVRRVVCCDHCNVRGIRGDRYLCGMCADYDLCVTCERICEKVHDKSHVFVKVPHTLNPNMMEGKTLLPSDYLSGNCSLENDPEFAACEAVCDVD